MKTNYYKNYPHTLGKSILQPKFMPECKLAKFGPKLETKLYPGEGCGGFKPRQNPRHLRSPTLLGPACRPCITFAVLDGAVFLAGCFWLLLVILVSPKMTKNGLQWVSEDGPKSHKSGQQSPNEPRIGTNGQKQQEAAENGQTSPKMAKTDQEWPKVIKMPRAACKVQKRSKVTFGCFWVLLGCFWPLWATVFFCFGPNIWPLLALQWQDAKVHYYSICSIPTSLQTVPVPAFRIRSTSCI